MGGGEGGVKAVMDIVVDQAPPSRHHRIIKYVSVSMCTGHVERILTECFAAAACVRRLDGSLAGVGHESVLVSSIVTLSCHHHHS